MFLCHGRQKKYFSEDEIAAMLLASDSENEIDDLDGKDEDIILAQSKNYSRIGADKDEMIEIDECDHYPECEHDTIQEMHANDKEIEADFMTENKIENHDENIYSDSEINNKNNKNPGLNTFSEVSQSNATEFNIEDVPIIFECEIPEIAHEEEIINDYSNEIIENLETPLDVYTFTRKSDIEWSKNKLNQRNFDFSDIIETSSSSVLPPIDYFYNYIPKKFFDEMALHTNLYANQNNTNWKSTSAGELIILFGLHIAMGVVKLSQLAMYWSNEFPLPLFTENMTKKRFSSLRNNLHMVNVLEKPTVGNDRLWKVRPLIDHIKNRCNLLQPEKILSVDEQIIPMRNKFNIKQYIKGKFLFN